MKSIDLTYILGNALPEPVFQPAGYEARTRCHVNTKPISWIGAWSQLLGIALHQQGADVSEIGTTWLGSLIEMEALRPFTAYEIRRMGGAEAFAPSSWQTCFLPGDARIMAVPWYLDMPMVLYRKDLLQRAGIDEKEAFKTPEQFTDTLSRLKANGHEFPLSMPLENNRVVHTMAAWIWSNGGHYRTPDAKKMALREANALKGIRSYFDLHRFTYPAWAEEFNDRFLTGKSPVVLSSDQVYFGIRSGRLEALPEVKENIGLAAHLSTPYIGGSNLVIWKHTPLDRDANELVQYLCDFEVLSKAFQLLNILPARLALIEKLPVASDPAYPVILETLRVGRGFSGYYRWAGIEERLVHMISTLWRDIFSAPDMDLDKVVPARVTELADRLERTILGTWK